MKKPSISKFIKINVYYGLVVALLTMIMPLPIQSEPLKINIWANTETQKSFQGNSYDDNILNNSKGIQFKKLNPNISSQLTINILNDDQILFDQSFLNFSSKNITLGFGKVSRNWSFSPKQSLILSHNGRPPTSIYIKIETDTNSENNFFSWLGPWSFEGFNSFLSNTTEPNDTMLLGLRAVFEPLQDFKFELVKTSQWGGEGYNPNFSQFRSAIIGNTNEYEFAHINQLAGFGLSYSNNIRQVPLRLYAQFIGEDEAGNLPSCYMSLLGGELNLNGSRFLSKIGLEYTDTRIDFTSHGFCGPNTAYNNNTYQYTNYDISLGAPIDTEGKSLNFWGSTNLNNNTTLNYSITNVIINDYNWKHHRLTSSRQNGWLSSIGASWKIRSLELNADLKYQDFSLHKNNIKQGISLNLNTKYSF